MTTTTTTTTPSANALTQRLTAFTSFEALITAGGDYRPTLRADAVTPMDRDAIDQLRDLYDVAQMMRGDWRRAYPEAPHRRGLIGLWLSRGGRTDEELVAAAAGCVPRDLATLCLAAAEVPTIRQGLATASDVDPTYRAIALAWCDAVEAAAGGVRHLCGGIRRVTRSETILAHQVLTVIDGEGVEWTLCLAPAPGGALPVVILADVDRIAALGALADHVVSTARQLLEAMDNGTWTQHPQSLTPVGVDDMRPRLRQALAGVEAWGGVERLALLVARLRRRGVSVD